MDRIAKKYKLKAIFESGQKNYAKTAKKQFIYPKDRILKKFKD